jgi:hypothetical protein
MVSSGLDGRPTIPEETPKIKGEKKGSEEPKIPF